jgi:hypothetical protein
MFELIRLSKSNPVLGIGTFGPCPCGCIKSYGIRLYIWRIGVSVHLKRTKLNRPNRKKYENQFTVDLLKL